MTAIIITESLNPLGVAMLEKNHTVRFLDRTAPPAEQLAVLRNAEVIVSQIYPIDRSLIETSPNLVAIAKHGVGVDNIDVAAASERGIPVLVAPGANAHSVAEHTIGLILHVARRVPELDAAVRRRDYSIRSNLHLMELRGRTIAVLGAGATGREVLDLACRGLGMHGIAYDIAQPPAGSLPDGVEFTESLLEALSRADVVSVHLPLFPETRHLIGAPQLAAMPAGSVLINSGRGGVVDENALAQAITSGHLLGAGVDVFEQEPPAADNPLLALGPRVVVTPHAAGLSDRASEAIARTIAADILRILSGDAPEHAVNAPALAPRQRTA